MKRQTFSKDEFISMLQEIQLHRGKYRHMLHMDTSEPPDSKTRMDLKKLIKYLEGAGEVEIRFK